MGLIQNEFIELNRTFHELSQSSESDDIEPRSLYGSGKSLTWADLISHYRVVLLSEAGSGKSAEIRNTARHLREEEKFAFFVRLEHVADGLEDALEEGTDEEFAAWLEGTEEGWILLDSVDESRLRDPFDFERAVKKLGRILGSAKQRAHIVITGRTTAWRPKTDLMLCMQYLSYATPVIEEVGGKESSKQGSNLLQRNAHSADESMYKIVAFDSLSYHQVEAFSKAKGISDTKGLLDAVERADAWSFTSRPQDLADLVTFWSEHRRIGSRLELIESGVKRRLEERDQKRADARPITVNRIRAGVCAVAAACTLAQTQTVRVPDGSENTKGLPIKEILPDWDDQDCATLLSRPVFDQAIYGTVRFHHRTVREYLTAEWFSHLLKQDTSRRRVEELFFREQYGLEVVVPSLRPVLPWLALMDGRISERVRKLAPEVFFEGGDPSKLPLETRRQVLHQVCDQFSKSASSRSMMDYSAVQRFAGADLTEDVVTLLKTHAANDDLLWFLLRMVWHGQLKGALKESERIALDARAERHVRIAAIRAVGAIGSVTEMTAIRSAILDEPMPLRRDLVAELLKDIHPSEESIQWLFDCIGKVGKPERYSAEVLSPEIVAFIERTDFALLPLAIGQASLLLNTEPFIERRECEISADYAWLLVPMGVAVQRMVESRSPDTLSLAPLDILYKLPLAREYDHDHDTDIKLKLAALVPEWQELNLSLFWFIAEHQRVQKESLGGQLNNWWAVGIWRSFVRFGPEAFNSILACVTGRQHPDDRLIALTLAHRLYQDGGRLVASRLALNAAVRGDSVLSERLEILMRPAPLSAEERKFHKSQAEWQRRAKARQQKESANNKRWREAMRANPDGLRAPKLKRLGDISNWQYLVHEHLRKLVIKSSNRKARDWTLLNDEFGAEVACAFRDGAVAYWRRRKPGLSSEGAPVNQRDFADVFGLTGLEIESQETPNWPSNLTDAEAELAFRYGMHELNGFPDWMPRLFAKFPELVRRMSLTEIRYELDLKDDSNESFYLLYDISWTGDWLWDAVAPELYEAVNHLEPKTISSVQRILKVLNGSALPDGYLIRLARRKVRTLKRPAHLAAWYACWVGVEPNAAVPALRSYLAEIRGSDACTTFAMLFVTKLIGGRRGEGPGARRAYQEPAHLKDLYLLMHEHIRRQEDIERAGRGVYSPGLRDDAQSARDNLFRLLQELPGKETYLAFESISQVHPDEEARPWFVLHAKAKAELDADGVAWTPAEVREFQVALERTPTNNRDLFDLAVLRLTDLKDDLENGDSSIADTLRRVTQETEMRKVIGNWCRERSANRYHVPQEEELADAKRPDLRFLGVGFDAPLPVELKLAENWSGSKLYERMEVQLCGDYLRDRRSSRGIFLLIYSGRQGTWELPDRANSVDFSGLVDALQSHWRAIAHRFPNVYEIRVLGIDLTKRMDRRPATKQASKSTKGERQPL